MPQLTKAVLQEIKSDTSRKPVGPEVQVQLNPTSLSLTLSNQIEGGRSRGRQARQYIGSSSSVLKLELVFDTADEGTTGNPRSVREKTNFLERFILPQKAGAKETPPKLRFIWGNLVFEGIVESLSFDFDHFAHDGKPLRAKANLSIKEQDAEYQFLKTGPGANEAPGSRKPGAAPAGAPGSSGGLSAQVGVSLAGETAVEFSARVGLEPSAWRGLDADFSAGLSLDAGVEVGFNAGLQAGAGLGVHVGVDAGADLSVEAAFGLDASANAGFGADFGASLDAGLAAGFALSASGGVNAALHSVQIAKSGGAAQKAVDAFAAPAGASAGAALASPASAGALPAAASSTAVAAAPAAGAASPAAGAASPAARPARPEQKRTPLSARGLPSPAEQAAAAPAPPLPRADPRAKSFGFGVPLRQRVTVADERSVVFRQDPTTPPWIELPARDAGRLAADGVQQDERRPAKPCGCHGPCRHSGGRPR